MDRILDKNIETSWFSLSLPAQMVNIGNEVKRAFRFSDLKKQNTFLDKAIFYTELTSKDEKNSNVSKEILIGLEVLENLKNNNSIYSKNQILKYYKTFSYFL